MGIGSSVTPQPPTPFCPVPAFHSLHSLGDCYSRVILEELRASRIEFFFPSVFVWVFFLFIFYDELDSQTPTKSHTFLNGLDVHGTRKLSSERSSIFCLIVTLLVYFVEKKDPFKVLATG